MVVIDGMRFPEGVDELHANLWLFANGERDAQKRYEALVRAIDLAFNCAGSIRRVVWNEWTERMLRSAVGDWEKKRFLGVAGCSSSGKSDGFGLYALMSYWSRPADTYGFVMSTTKGEAKKRIWKSVTQLWAQAQRVGCPGKLLDSMGMIKGVNKLGQITENSGIYLVAAGKAEVGQAASSLIGLKNPNMVIVADEMPDLGDGILEAAWKNLTSNDRVTFVGLGNPNLLNDPFGKLCEPKEGWKSITEDSEGWETNYGRAIRFNAEKSPRITEPDGERYYWQPDQAYVDTIANDVGGRKSRGYYRFVKAFWCPEGIGNNIYTESELMNGCAMDEQEPRWDESPTLLASLDPAFTRGGDRSQAGVAKLGRVDGKPHLHICHYQVLEEDIANKKVSPSHQIVAAWKQMADDWGVRPSRAILDGTGSGISFGHLVDTEWSPAVQKVIFNSKASERTVIFRGEDCEYFNKNSELWIQPKEYIRMDQISGISKELMTELVMREYHDKQGRTLRVESKEEAKKKMGGKSPDLSDMFLLLVEKAITLGHFQSEEVRKVSKMVDNGWSQAKVKRSIQTTCGRRMQYG
jgi:hypothetical protein